MIEILIGVSMSLITWIAGKFKLDKKMILTVLVVVSAAAYTLFLQYTDEATQTTIVTLATKIAGSATLFYNTITLAMSKKSSSL